MQYSKKIMQLISLLTCFFLIMVVSIRRDGRILGHQSKQNIVEAETSKDTLQRLGNDIIVVNTTDLGSDIIGYGGTVPLAITIKDNVVMGVKALENTETVEFFEEASTLLSSWDGKTIDEAQALQVDVISGATFTSRAIIGNMQAGLQYATQNAEQPSVWSSFDFSIKNIIGLIVVLMAAVLPLFIKNKRYHLVQQILNVVVLGFWCGSFLNYTSIISYMSNGMNIVLLAIPTIMLITAFIYPLFGKKNYYCAQVCPFGAMQGLAGRCVKYKLRMKATTTHRLDLFRQVLWALLMLCLWTGVWFDWIDYEPFSAFIFQSASWVVIVLAVLFVLLSTIMVRPYCRFVCPTGSLFKLSQFVARK